MKVTVAICTHNPRPDVLERAVAAIVPQLVGARDVEFLVVDNASEKPVASLACMASAPARIVVEPQLGLTAARACVGREARGELVIFVDDDNVLDECYVERACALFEDPKLGVLSGWVEPEYVERPPGWLRRHEAALAIRRPIGTHVEVVRGFKYSPSFPIGAGMVVRTALLRDYFRAEEANGRIEGRRGTDLLAGEDTDLALFAISQGWNVGCSGALRLLHVIPPARMSPEYIIRLNRGALLSATAVNSKWRARFGGDVFEFLSEPRWRAFLKVLAFGVVSFLPAFRVRAAAQRDLARIRSHS